MLARLQSLATATLEELITPKGIYASSNKGEAGRYHTFFGRDSIITAAFIHEVEKKGKKQFLPNAITSILRLSDWQGEKDNPMTREQPGKILHEIWEDSSNCEHLVEGRIQAGLKPFYVDFSQKAYINWFSNDSTPLWVIEVLRLYKDELLEITPTIEKKLEKALEWCLLNIKQFDGFAGFEYDANSKYHEPFIQGWKDSQRAFLTEQGDIPKQPIKDVAVNAFVWAAMIRGYNYFKDKNKDFAVKLKTNADSLKQRFNTEDGFLMKLDEGYFFSDALDGDNTQLKGIAADVGIALWSAVDGECIIDNTYIKDVVSRLLQQDFLDPQAGLRIYSTKNKVFDEEEYHRGEHTYWPFVSGLVAWGMRNFRYDKESDAVLSAMLKGVERFGSCIEMFLKKNGEYVRYVEPSTKQVSSTDQAWTAGAVYYATSS